MPESKEPIQFSYRTTDNVFPEKVDPCPFCKNIGIRVDSDGMTSQVFCRYCGARGPYVHGGWEEAVKRWNEPRLHQSEWC